MIFSFNKYDNISRKVFNNINYVDNNNFKAGNKLE